MSGRRQPGRKRGQQRPIPPRLRDAVAAFCKTVKDWKAFQRANGIGRTTMTRYASGKVTSTGSLATLHRLVGWPPPTDVDPEARLSAAWRRLDAIDRDVAMSIVAQLESLADALGNARRDADVGKEAMEAFKRLREAALKSPLSDVH